MTNSAPLTVVSVLLLAPIGLQAQPALFVVADSVEGVVEWRDSADSIRVIEPSELPMCLARTAHIRVAGEGSVRLLASGGGEEVRSETSFRPAQIATAIVGDSTHDGVVADGLAHLQRLGRERAGGAAVYWPAAGSRVSPEHLTVRRIRSEDALAYTVTREGQQFPEHPGELGPEETEVADIELRHFLLQDGSRGPFIMSTVPEIGLGDSIRFHALTVVERTRLAGRLKDLEAEPTTFKLLGSAAAFLELGLRPEAADKYEELLLRLPESEVLKRKLASLLYSFGDTQRADDLLRGLGAEQGDWSCNLWLRLPADG